MITQTFHDKKLTFEVASHELKVYKGDKVATFPYETYDIHGQINKVNGITSSRLVVAEKRRSVKGEKAQSIELSVTRMKVAEYEKLLDALKRSQIIHFNPELANDISLTPNPTPSTMNSLDNSRGASEQQEVNGFEEKILNRSYKDTYDLRGELRMLTRLFLIGLLVIAVVSFFATKSSIMLGEWKHFLGFFFFLSIFLVLAMFLSFFSDRARRKRGFERIVLDRSNLRIDQTVYPLSQMKKRWIRSSYYLEFGFTDANGKHKFTLNRFTESKNISKEEWKAIYGELHVALFMVGFTEKID